METINNTTMTNQNSQEPQEPNIMSVFEMQQDSDSQVSVSSTQINVQSDAVNDDITNAVNNIDVDPRFANLPKAEALMRTYQSRYDKLYAEHQNVLREIEEYRKTKELFEKLYEDDELFEAFVYTRKPDLVKPKDITEVIKEKMKEEFGDYRPTREEAEEDPGGKAWLYYKRLDELYEQYSKGYKEKAKSFEEVLKQKALEKEMQEKRVMEEINKVKENMKWSDEQVMKFRDWASKLSVLDLAKIYNFAIRTMRVPTASSISGTSSSGTSAAREQFLKSLRG